ncbi:ABC transporter substrate-binding protein [Methanococcoides sp. SA1]|nr:ABC transporter substrate-binding protein [Methanococcoides sp. SA1]
MKLSKEISVVVGIALLLSLVLIIHGSPLGSLQNTEITDNPEINSADKNTQITIIDALGREVTLDKPAERIAYTHFAVAEIILAVGAWDQVVARDGYISDENFYLGLEEIPAISSATNNLDVNYEKIIEAQPDVFIMPSFGWHADNIDEIIDTLEPEIPVVFVEPLNPDTFLETVQIIGLISGNEAQAHEYIDFYNGIYNPIVAESSKLSPEERVNVFYKFDSGDPEQIATFGKEMIGTNEFFYAAGARNIAGELPFSYSEVDKEWLLEQDMDAIIIMCRDIFYPGVFSYTADDPEFAREEGPKIRNEFKNMDVFSHSDAVKNEEVYLLHSDLLVTPRYIISIAYMAKWFHPELYPDLDPEALHQEYIDRFVGANYNVSNAGLFAYPA